MKKEIKIMVYKNGVFTLATKKAENYDEFSYYVCPRKNDIIRIYSLYDKNTGYEVCNGKTKKELLERYECMKDCYANIREKICYKELTNKYKEMLEKMLEN